MLMNYFLFRPHLWFIPVVLQAIGYFGVLRKMGLPTIYALIPGAADWKLSTKFFRSTHSFWRPFITTTILVICAFYLNPFGGTGQVTARIFLVLALFVYELFLFRLYRRLSKSFGKGLFFTLLTFLLPPLGLCVLGYGRPKYLGDPDIKHTKDLRPIPRLFVRVANLLISLAEVAVVVLAVGIFTIRAYPPRMLAQYLLKENLEKTWDVTGTGDVVAREDTMGEAAASLASMPVSRSKFFPDHSQDKSVVVMVYVVGSDLEDRAGLSSANIAQMLKASEQGSALTFVLETGGSKRWFTKGIAEGTYGRYTIKDGKLEKIQELDSSTCMSEPQTFADFIGWAKETYPADRYILALWDHGSGFSMGYGYDAYNKRDADIPLLSVSEIADAIGQSGVRFDIIGFDACLMQDLNVAVALEPYADYLLASQEVEGGYGWCWTSAFGMLAANPALPSEDFGREMIACYDPYNTIINDDEPDTVSTLSFVDLPLAKAAYKEMEGLFATADTVMRDESSAFADVSLSGTKSYGFQSGDQIDLIDFLSRLKQLDYDEQILTEEECDALVNSVRACVLYRNGNSADGVNGISITFPVKSVNSYNLDYKLFNHFSLDVQRNFYSDFFSIIAAQNKKTLDSYDPETATARDLLTLITTTDYTEEEWYVSGFEDYEDTPALLDIPLTEVENGYRIEMPEKAWDIIADARLIAYQKTDDGLLRYLGMDNIGAVDEDGRPLVAMDGTWVFAGNHLCCYEAGEPRETEDGVIFTGTTKAVLNGTETIKLFIEWDPVAEEGDEPISGHVVGYVNQDADSLVGFLEGLLDEGFLDSLQLREKKQLSPGDRVSFLFDYYDEAGELVKTEPYGSTMIVTNQERVDVSDVQLRNSDIVFGGVLTDVYQRVMTTEKIEAHAE